MYFTFKIKDKEIGFDTTILKRILLVLLVIFLVININLIGAIFTNTTRFVFGQAKRYEENIEHFKECIENEEKTIYFDNIQSGTERNRIAHEILEGTPEIFYISSMSYQQIDNYKYKFMVSYRYTGQALKNAKLDFDNRLNAIVENIDKKASDYEKVNYIHNYISDNFYYDQDKTDTIHDPYRMLLNGKGVCSAYAGLFKALCNKVGLKCEVVWTKADNHGWNVVKLNGFWYHVDVTWDDIPGGSTEYYLMPDMLILGGGHHQWTCCGKYVRPCIRFKYFLKNFKTA